MVQKTKRTLLKGTAAAVGAATAQRIKEHHFHVDLVAENFHAESLVETFRKQADV